MSDVKETLNQRGSIYGDYGRGIEARNQIMDVLDQHHAIQNGHQLPAKYRTMLLDIVSKLVRLGATPDHLDSIHDVQGYAKLYEEELHKKSQTVGSARAGRSPNASCEREADF